MNNSSNFDFSIVFNGIEKYKMENPNFEIVEIEKQTIDDDNTIRDFTDICKEINSRNESSMIFMTFA